MAYYRSISSVEFVYLAAETDTKSLFVNQFILEGKGDFILADWQHAVKEASLANPGIKLRLKGHWFWRYWDDDAPLPTVKVLKNSWDGLNSENTEFLNGKIDPRIDPTAEVILIEGAKQLVCFRSHHSVTDGIGHMHWIKDIFRVLNGENPIGSRGKINEYDIAERLGFKYAPKESGSCLNATPNAKSPEIEGCRWTSFRWDGGSTKILAKFLLAVANVARDEHGEGKVMYRIPADLRRYMSKDEEFPLTNVSGVFDLEVGADDTVSVIQNNIFQAMRKNEDIEVIPKSAKYAKFLPKYLFKPKQKVVTKMHKTGLACYTGLVSFLGRTSLTSLSYAEFEGLKMYGVPIALNDRSVYIGIWMDEHGVTGSIGVPNALADELETEQLKTKILSALDKL